MTDDVPFPLPEGVPLAPPTRVGCLVRSLVTTANLDDEVLHGLADALRDEGREPDLKRLLVAVQSLYAKCNTASETPFYPEPTTEWTDGDRRAWAWESFRDTVLHLFWYDVFDLHGAAKEIAAWLDRPTLADAVKARRQRRDADMAEVVAPLQVAPGWEGEHQEALAELREAVREFRETNRTRRAAA